MTFVRSPDSDHSETLLNVCRQLGEINFGNTPLRFNHDPVRLIAGSRSAITDWLGLIIEAYGKKM
jgi:hypothetical protein